MSLSRVAIISDLHEEDWPSMDLVGEMLAGEHYTKISEGYLAE